MSLRTEQRRDAAGYPGTSSNNPQDRIHDNMHAQQQHQQQQQHRQYTGSQARRMNHNDSVSSSLMGSTHMGDRNSMGDIIDLQMQSQPTPLQKRMATVEVHERRNFKRVLEEKNRRIIDLERIEQDLSVRLEREFRRAQHLETSMEERERQWTKQFEQLELDCDEKQKLIELERENNRKLSSRLSRKDADIRQMMRQKYAKSPINNNKRESSPGRGSVRDVRKSNEISPGGVVGDNPEDCLRKMDVAELARTEKAETMLKQFFGLPMQP